MAETLEARRLLSISPFDTASGSLSGQATAAASSNDLTNLGAEDWAHWGRGGVFGKFDHDDDGGSEISDISLVGSGTQTGANTDSALTFNWTNGSHLQTATAEDGFITDSGAIGSGFSFTVPADTDSRTLTVFAGGDNARITLDAHLSDSSATDYTFTAASPGLFNEAITITYSAALADQELTITLTKQGTVGSGSAGSVDLSAAALDLNSIKTLATFDSAPAAGPVMDDEGNFYATFRDAKGYYGLYEIPAGGGQAVEVGTFSHWNMASDLIADSTGDVFGTAVCADGYDDYLFEIYAATHKLKTLVAFDGTNGSSPTNLMLDGAGNLYGMTSDDAVSGGYGGTIFEVTPSTGKFQTLAQLDFYHYQDQFDSVIDNAGNIFFTENPDYYDDNKNTIFELPAGGATVKTLLNFSTINLFVPEYLTVDRFGNLYCAASNDSGDDTIFQFAPHTHKPVGLYTFHTVNAVGDLVVDQNGNLYGAAFDDKLFTNETVFEIHTKQRKFSALASYVPAKFANYLGNLLLDGAGDVFGTGSVAIELPAGSRAIETIGTPPGGDSADDALLADASGNLYGISTAREDDGGEQSTLFEIPKSGYVPASPSAASDAIRHQSTMAVSSGASLTGQSASVGSPVDLTTLGTGDWAHFGTGGQINAFDDNANASDQISNVTILGSGAEATVSQDPSRAVSWTNGTPDATATDETGYLSVSGSTTATLSFTVPADQNQRTLYIEAGGTNSQITLTAHLSDGSAADYVATASGTGVYTNLYTLVYQAGADNQTLTITLQKTGNVGSSDGSVDLIAAALRGPTVSQIATIENYFFDPLGVAYDASGNLYVAGPVVGNEVYNPSGGVVYKFSAGTYTESTLATISGTPLTGPLVVDKFGNLYGWVALAGDTSSFVQGIFEIPAGTNTLEPVLSEAALGGNDVIGSLSFDPYGNLLVVNDGGLVEVAAGTHHVTVLSNALPDGYTYDTAFDSSGDLFGVTSNYGTMTSTVFEVPASGSAVVTLASLSGTDEAGIVVTSGGIVYGTDPLGGTFGDGTIFEITPGDHRLKTLLNCQGAGGPPFLQVGSDGDLFGLSENGTEVDEFFPADGALLQLASFPYAVEPGLMVDRAGNLYGFATVAGVRSETSRLYRLSAATDRIATLANFPSMVAYSSDSNFVDAEGNFVGLDSAGVYELTDTGFDTSPSAPVINYQPTDETGITGQRVAFNASVNSTPAPAVQWQISTDGGKTFTDITGNPSATTQSLILSDLNADQAGEQFRAVFTNSLGTTISNAATLSIVPPLKLVSPAHPDAKTVNGKSIGVDALAVDPSGKSKLTYTWSVVKTPSVDATVSFSANGTPAAAHVTARFKEAGQYTLRCTITDGGVRTIITDTPVTVVQTPTQVLIPRGPIALGPLDTAYVDAYVFDQFNDQIQSPQPAIKYSIVAGLGQLDSQTGEFTATRFLGPVEVRASSGSLSALLEITVEH